MRHIINELDKKLNDRSLAPNRHFISISPELEEYIMENDLYNATSFSAVYYNQFEIIVDNSYKEEEFQIKRR